MDKKLLRSVREYKKQSFLTPVLVAAEVFVEVLIPLLMAKIIDVGIMNGDMAYIIKLGALLVLLAVVALFFGAKAGQLAAVASSGYAKNLRLFIRQYRSFFNAGTCDKTDDRHYERTDGVYVYDPSACKSADHDRDVPDHDSDDQSCDRAYDVDHDSGFGRTFDLYRKESAPAFYQGV